MTKTKSILIVIFALICVAVGLISPYMFAGVNEQAVQENQIDVTIDNYNDVNLGAVYNLSIEKVYSGSYFLRAYMGEELYSLFGGKCSDNDTVHNGWLESGSKIISHTYTYSFVCSDSNGYIISKETKHLKMEFSINDFESVDLLIKTYDSSSNLLLSETIKELTYVDTLYEDGSVKNRTFEYSVNLENLDTYLVTLTLINLDNPSFDGHIHNYI